MHEMIEMIIGNGSEDPMGMLLDQSDKDRTHHNQNQATHDSSSYICRGYLRNYVLNGNKQMSDNEPSEFIDRFAKIHNDG